MERIGLVAGSGKFPYIFAEEAKRKKAVVIAFAIKGVTGGDFGSFVDRIHWIDPENFNIHAFVLLLFAERIRKIVMVGKIDKAAVFDRMRVNRDIGEVLKSTKDNRDYSILEEVTKRFKQIGIQVIAGMDYLSDLLPEKGVLTKRYPTEGEKGDIEFGMRIAREITRLDIGQTITVKNKSVVTIEAMEGTDETVKRAGELVKDEFTVIKAARPGQDMRWDVPLIGPDTIKVMLESNARVLAIESGKMFFMEREKALKEADLHSLTVVVV